MSNVLITIGVLIVAVLSALFAVPHFVDWNSYRGVIEEEASRAIGRDVRIGGDIKLQLLPAPSFVIQKLRVADAATGSGEPLFRAERVDAHLSIVPLVRGVLEANRIELVKPALRLVVDEAGQGNWRSLVRGSGTLPYLPNEVALQAVTITDGTLRVLDHAGGRERLTLEHIEGQLSAPALEGPYRFRGSFGAGTDTRELRFTTLPADADGVVQVKANLKDIASNATATLDGRLRDLGGRPELTGELSAMLPLPRASPPAAAAGGAKQPTVPTAELKATVTGNAKVLALNGLSVAFEASGRPEVLAGEATFSWEGERTTVAKLSTPWIDLDNVLGNPEGGNPLLALAGFAQRINGLGAGIGTASAVLQIDQANLGHDLIGGVRLEARSNGGVLAVEHLRGSLPGGTRVEMQGRIVGEGGATTFDGDMTVRGTSLARLAGWASAGGTVISPANDQPFHMRSRVTAEPARGGLRNIVGQIGDSTLEGEVDYAWRGARKLRVTIAGSRLDARAVAPLKLTMRTLSEFLARPSAADKPSTTDLAVAVNLKTAELVLAEQTLRDVTAVVETSGSELAVDQLQFSADHGVAVSLSGRVGKGGQLRGSVAAADADGAQKLAEFLGVPLTSLVPAPLLPEVLPLSLAGTLIPAAEPGGKAVSLTLDGQAGQTDVKIRLALAAGIEDWRTAPADIDIVLLAPPEAQLAAKVLAALRLQNPSQNPSQDTAAARDLLATVAARPSDKSAAATTRLALRATGIPGDGLSTAARFDSPELTVFVDGLSHVAASGTLQLTGDVTIDARDGRSALDAAGGLRLALAEPLILQGTARLNARGGGVGLSKIALVSGSGRRVSGKLDLDAVTASAAPDQPAPRRLSGELSLSALDAGTLFAPVLQVRPAEAQAAIQVTSGRAGLWPDANFEFGRNRAVDVNVGLKVGALALADGVGLADVEMRLLSRAGSLEIRNLAGTGLGGRMAGSAVLDATPNGATLTAKLDFAGIQLANFGSSGTADLALTLTGSGINPAGIVSGLVGNGTLKLAAAAVREVTPETLQAAIDTALKAPADKLSATLRLLLADDGARGSINLGQRTIALTTADGIVRTPAVTVSAQAGRVVGHAALDLASFGISGDWRVETRMPPLPPMPPLPGEVVAVPVPVPATLLPAVVQRFSFAPADLGSSRRVRRPAYDTEPLERELAVRKVERDLAELERLRRLDEERVAARMREAIAADAAEKARQAAADAAANKASVTPEPIAAPMRP